MMASENEIRLPSLIHLYGGTSESELDARELVSFLLGHFPQSSINFREEFFRFRIHRHEETELKVLNIAEKIAQTKVRRPDRGEYNSDPMPAEVNFEQRFLTTDRIKPVGILYDGYRLGTICSELLATDEMNLDHCHIVLTNQLLGTWDESDCRYHVRVSIYGFPSLVSTSGMVEGPAKPREYYLGRRLGVNYEERENAFNEKCVRYGDIRLREIIKGYLLQVLFYHSTGDPFCNDRDCRLFNAHWQEEMIHAQLRPNASLCHFHQEILKSALCS